MSSETKTKWAREARECGLKKFWFHTPCICGAEVFYTSTRECVACRKDFSLKAKMRGAA